MYWFFTDLKRTSQHDCKVYFKANSVLILRLATCLGSFFGRFENVTSGEFYAGLSI